MTVLDCCYVVLITCGLLVDHFLAWPTFLRRSQIDAPSARFRLWITFITLLWTLANIGIAIWILSDRLWSTLGMNLPQGWRLWVSAILVIAFTLLQIQTAMKVARMPGPKPKLSAQYGQLSIMLPHSVRELWWFIAVSLTAGFCEEFLFRGYLIWAFAPLLGWWGAAILSLLAFTAVHLYQGRAGTLRSGIMGAIFTLLVVILDSLLPAIVLHALIDASSGVIAWLVLREESVGFDLAKANNER